MFDTLPFARSGTVYIFVISILNMYLAGLMLSNPLTINATNITAIVLGFHALHMEPPLATVEWSMIGFAALAMAGAVLHLGRARLAFFVPQAVILGGVAYGGQAA